MLCRIQRGERLHGARALLRGLEEHAFLGSHIEIGCMRGAGARSQAGQGAVQGKVLDCGNGSCTLILQASHASLDTRFASSFAEGNWSPPHVYIAGHTPRHAKPFLEKRERRSFSVAIFVRLGFRPIVIPVREECGTAANEEQGKQATTAPQVTGVRFVEMLETHLLRGRMWGNAVHSTRLAEMRLVVDKGGAHTSKVFRGFAEHNGIEVTLIPTRSPDLDPLDYGVFGGVKQAWAQRVTGVRLDWEGQKKALLDILQGWNADAAIKDLPRRIGQCIKRNGGHFE